ALLALAIPATASAAVTSSSITTPTGPFFFLNDLSPGQTAMNITVSGTSNGTSGDMVDLNCYYGTYIPASLAASVPVASDGTFTYTGVVNNLEYYTCMLRAVPHGDPTNHEPDTNPSDDTFKGPVIAG